MKRKALDHPAIYHHCILIGRAQSNFTLHRIKLTFSHMPRPATGLPDENLLKVVLLASHKEMLRLYPSTPEVDS